MTMARYSVGNEFKVIKMFNWDNKFFSVGHTGTIVKIKHDGVSNLYYIKWNHTNKGFHNCSGYCEDGYGWCVSSRMIDNYTQPIELKLISKNPLPEDPRLRGIALKIIQLEKKFKRNQDAKRSLANV